MPAAPTSVHPDDHLSSALSDQAHAACMRHDRFESELAQQSAHPHGQCMRVSSAIRLRGIPPNPSRMAFGVVLTFCSRTISPVSSSTQYQLERSPRSSPIVSFG